MSQQSKLQRNERKPMEREGEGEGQKDRHILELQPIRTEDCNIRKVVQDNRHTEMTTWHHANVCFVYTSLVQKKKTVSSFRGSDIEGFYAKSKQGFWASKPELIRNA